MHLDYPHIAVLMIQSWRKRRGLTLAQLAKKAGTTQNALAAKFQRKSIDAALFLKIIHVLEIKTFDKEFEVMIQDFNAQP